jgi:hypothetical protein
MTTSELSGPRKYTRKNPTKYSHLSTDEKLELRSVYVRNVAKKLYSEKKAASETLKHDLIHRLNINPSLHESIRISNDLIFISLPLEDLRNFIHPQISEERSRKIKAFFYDREFDHPEKRNDKSKKLILIDLMLPDFFYNAIRRDIKNNKICLKISESDLKFLIHDSL